MNEIFSLKAILTTLISLGVIGSLKLPVRAYETEKIDENKAELILGHSFPALERRGLRLTAFRGQNYGYSEQIDSTEPTDNLRNIIGLTGLAIGTGVVGYHLTRVYKPSLANSLPVQGDRNTALLDRVSPKLRRELLRLVHNKATASRLLSGTRLSHPDRNPNWLAEKVIYDLKRGR